MIERYKSPLIEFIWNEETKFSRWRMLEIACCEAFYRRGKITEEEIKNIRNIPHPTIDEIQKIEKQTHHDMAAFVQILGKFSPHIHYGLTSSDIVDTAQAIAIKYSLEHLYQLLSSLSVIICNLAVKYKYTPCMARTHGMYAEISTFGIRILNWYSELKRNIVRLKKTKENISYGKLSGAIGIYGPITPEMEAEILNNFELQLEPISTQIIPRDRYAELFCFFSLLAGFCERVATELRILQRTEIREVAENFSTAQIGSSAMPHKKNPISSEKICGLVRLIRSYNIAALENMNLWEERDISHSSVERLILPDAFHVMVHMIEVLKNVLGNLEVFPNKMLENINLNQNIYSQDILNLLIDKGLNREESYKIVQQNIPTSLITAEEWKNIKINHLQQRLQFVDKIFERVLIL